MITLASLDNEVIFKKAFTDKLVFERFVRDILGIEVKVGKIETEKQFSPKVGNIDFKLDIFAETTDRRVLIELQRVEYDHNFDRFLHYFLALIIEQQRRAVEYGIQQTVYAIVLMTEPYTIRDKSGRAVRNEVLLMEINPQTLLGEKIPLYGHQFVVLNPNHPEEHTPKSTRDWLDLFYQSVHKPEGFAVNEENEGIRRAVQLIAYDNLSPQEIAEMKNTEAARVALFKRDQAHTERVVRNAHAQNLPISMIATIAEISEEEVRRVLERSQ
jgi:hypothetical protein